MKIYFAITQNMLYKYEMPSSKQDINKFYWNLNENTYIGKIKLSFGEALDSICLESQIPCAICSAELLNKDIVENLFNNKKYNINVLVDKIIWINNKIN